MIKQIATAATLLILAGAASATVLTFDDTSYQGTEWGDMDAGYGGLNWSTNFDVYYGPTNGTGYNAGTISGDYAAFNSYGVDVNMSNGAFDWNGAWFNDPHNNTLLNVTGYLNGVQVYSTDIQLGYAEPIWFQADWTVDSLYFNVAENDWFTMDDFTFNEAPASVPEPASFVLLGLGLLGMRFARKAK